jgi:hypothetical protein
MANVAHDQSVLWRVESNGHTAHAVLTTAPRAKLAWYLNQQLLGSEEFEDRAAAMKRAEELRILVSVGGR